MPTKREKVPPQEEKDCNNFLLSRVEQKRQPDSGFISEGNLTEEISDARGTAEPNPTPDSGVGLSGIFSNLSIVQSSDLTQKATPEPLVDIREDVWKEYFEQDDDGDTFLHLAIIQGFLEAVLALIRVAPSPRSLDIPNDDLQTPLHLAVSGGCWQMVRWLIVTGAKPAPRDVRGDSPLHTAARNGDLMCCKAITDPVQDHERLNLGLFHPHHTQKQVDVDQWNYEGQTCVHVAAMKGHVHVIRHLISCGADINAREGRQGYTALHYAVQRNDEHLTRFLLFECDQLDADAITYGGSSVLQLGCSVPSTIAEELKLRGVPDGADL